MKSPFAIRSEDALSWHDADQSAAGVAERAGFRVRANARRWQVWATDSAFSDLIGQSRYNTNGDNFIEANNSLVRR